MVGFPDACEETHWDIQTPTWPAGLNQAEQVSAADHDGRALDPKNTLENACSFIQAVLGTWGPASPFN